MTDIVEIPETLPIAPFPALGSANYNQEAYDNGASVPPAIERARAIVAAGRTNAVAALEQALAAQESREQAVSETTAIKDAAVSETTAIKDAAVSETTAIKDAAVSETTAIKDAAVSETTAIKDAAALSAVAAADSAAAAQAVANFAGRWNEAAGALPKGTTVYHLGKFWVSLEALANVALAEPGVSPAWARAGGDIDTIAYDSRASLRARAGVGGDMVMTDGLGLFVFTTGSDEPDDDESCFAAAGGCWLLECPHWDVIADWQLPDSALRDEVGAILRERAICSISSVAAAAQASFSAFVPGAAAGDAALATPLTAVGVNIAITAMVAAADTAVVTLNNPSAAAASGIPAGWIITVFKEI